MIKIFSLVVSAYLLICARATLEQDEEKAARFLTGGDDGDSNHHTSLRAKSSKVEAGPPPGRCLSYIGPISPQGYQRPGFYIPDQILGLELLYDQYTNPNFEINIAAFVEPGEDCSHQKSVQLIYVALDGSEYRYECISTKTDGKFFQFSDGLFVPTVGEKQVTATTFAAPSCNGDYSLHEEYEFEVAYQSSLKLLLLRADNGAEICELTDGIALNLAKLPQQLTIRAKFYTPWPGDTVPPNTYVKFSLNRLEPVIERQSPYVIGGNDGSDYFDFSDTLKTLVGVTAQNALMAELLLDKDGVGWTLESTQAQFDVFDDKALDSPPACGFVD